MVKSFSPFIDELGIESSLYELMTVAEFLVPNLLESYFPDDPAKSSF